MTDEIKVYRSINVYLKEKYGEKIYRISLNGGMTCPNRDGKLDTRGCIFCSAGGSGEFAQPSTLSITDQIESGKKLLYRKQKDGKYIAYFQAFTNTYADIEYLRKIFYEAVRHPDIVILSIATRPDCLDDDVIELLAELNKIKPVWIELGLQTSNEKTAEYIRRCYRNEIFEKAVEKLKEHDIEYIVHLIIGLPFETREDIFESCRYVSSFRPNGIKFQLLTVLKGTDLEKEYLAGKFKTLTQQEYIEILSECIQLIPPDTIVHRLTGDSPHGLLVAPKWSENKWEVLNDLNFYMYDHKIEQGKKYKLIN